ncbi:hypothetical protein [uncultured Aliiroseovarius sp.]|uniref:hypothetical protein n=1 Tax=uncultured Aliiroseovarius sp. TaxID=1658783 RepID=UPI002591EF58|nr:hypothetical protein [uncultured Aliiroseovarius sp.]
MVLFGVISLNLLAAEEPIWFSKLGSAMIAWAIINLSLAREGFSNAATDWDRLRLVEHLNQMRELNRLQQESLNLTFDIHASQIAQLAREIGKPNPFIENDPEILEAFCSDINNRIAASTVDVESKALIEKLGDLENRYQKDMYTNNSWTKTIWRMEVFLLVWGTLQWGYGDNFVIWLKDLPQLFG